MDVGVEIGAGVERKSSTHSKETRRRPFLVVSGPPPPIKSSTPSKLTRGIFGAQPFDSQSFVLVKFRFFEVPALRPRLLGQFFQPDLLFHSKANGGGNRSLYYRRVPRRRCGRRLGRRRANGGGNRSLYYRRVPRR